MTSLDTQENERKAALTAASEAQTSQSQESAEEAFDLLTSYLLDYCPDDENWEDFDPDVDGARDVLIDMFDL